VETTDPIAVAAERLLAPIETEAAPVEDEQTEADDTEETELEAASDEADEDPVEDTDEDETEDADPKQPEYFTVKVAGKEVQVTLDDLKRDFSGQSYIQAKMQETAAAKKQAEQAYQALQAEQQRVMELAEALNHQGVIRPPTMPSPDLANKDPVAYIRAKAQYDAQFAQFQQQQFQIQNVQEQSRRANDAAMAAHLQAQAADLIQRIPDFANPETAAKTKAKLISAGKDFGFTDAELMGITDARAVQVLHDAARWRELQSSTAKAKKTPEAPKTVKTVARRPEPAQLARAKVVEKAKRSGRLDDWADALLK